MNFSELVTSSVLTRALALFLLFFIMVLAAVVVAYDYLTGHAIPAELWSGLTLGLGYALTILGLNFGVRLQENTPGQTTPPAETTPTGGTTNVSQP